MKDYFGFDFMYDHEFKLHPSNGYDTFLRMLDQCGFSFHESPEDFTVLVYSLPDYSVESLDEYIKRRDL